MKTLMMTLLLFASIGSASAFASSDCSKSSGNKKLTRAEKEKNEAYLALLTPEEGVKPKAKSKNGRVTR